MQDELVLVGFTNKSLRDQLNRKRKKAICKKKLKRVTVDTISHRVQSLRANLKAVNITNLRPRPGLDLASFRSVLSHNSSRPNCSSGLKGKNKP